MITYLNVIFLGESNQNDNYISQLLRNFITCIRNLVSRKFVPLPSHNICKFTGFRA